MISSDGPDPHEWSVASKYSPLCCNSCGITYSEGLEIAWTQRAVKLIGCKEYKMYKALK